MKSFFSLLFLVLSLTAWADYDSEKEAYLKFRDKEFNNPDNYVMVNNNPILTQKFFEKLKSDPQRLKYFLACGMSKKIDFKYQEDRIFALFLENHFRGKKLNAEEKEKVYEVGARLVFKSNPEEHKKAILKFEDAIAYYDKLLIQLQKEDF